MRLLLTLFIVLLAAGLSACEDPFQPTGPQFAVDTVTIAAPSIGATIPSALDITPIAPQAIRGGSFPEKLQEFDVQLRREGGRLVLAPAGALGFETGAGVALLPEGTALEDVTKAPGRSAFATDSVVPLLMDRVYVVRSRVFRAGQGTCQSFAKVRPLEVNLEAASSSLEVTANTGCRDDRLEDD